MAPVGDLLLVFCSQAPSSSLCLGAVLALLQINMLELTAGKKILLWVRATLTQLLKVSVLRRMLLKKGPLEIVICEKSISFLESSEILSTEAEQGLESSFTEKPSNWDEWGP